MPTEKTDFSKQTGDGNERCEMDKIREARIRAENVIELMNAIFMESKAALEKQRSLYFEPPEKPEAKANSRDPRETDSRQTIAQLLEPRIAPQHWGINE